jgi:hypothetical protein
MHRLILLAGASLALAACSEPATDPAPAEATPAPAPAARGAAAAGEPAEALNLAVQELTPADIERAALNGELACSFAPGLGGETLFLGHGNVDDAAGATGVIKLPDGVRVLAMDARGGFSAMSRGARFAGQDVAVAFALAGADKLPEEPQVAEESPAHPATMTVRSAQSEIAIQGVFECGP